MVTASPNHLGFFLHNSRVEKNIFIPKYYNPEIGNALNKLRKTHQLISISDLEKQGFILLSTGNEIGKMAYGTGKIPFIRTSDISNWEIITNPKQGVSEEIYQEYSKKQDLQEGDIFFVRDGTYLIGQTCLLTQHDISCLFQSHILKIRVKKNSPISAPLLLACLNAPIVKKQIRAKQFTADIIDTIGHRFNELILPVPKENGIAKHISDEVNEITNERIYLREQIRKIPFWIEGIINDLSDSIPEDYTRRIELEGSHGYLLKSSNVVSKIYIPKYYDTKLESDIKEMSKDFSMNSIKNMVKDGIISWDTGIEIGKMAYGTGLIPFIRTSDITNWELKSDPKQCVSEEIYEENKQDVKAQDIFVVRDGTYLVGTSCIITENETKILYCGGIYKLRVEDEEKIDPYLLLALLNTPIVRRQMSAKQFTRDIIDTLGKRLFEVVLPIPKDIMKCEKIASETRRIVENRIQLRNHIKEIALEVEGIKKPQEEDLEVIKEI